MSLIASKHSHNIIKVAYLTDMVKSPSVLSLGRTRKLPSSFSSRRRISSALLELSTL